MHFLNNPPQIHLDKPFACIPVKREGNKFIVDGTVQIARSDTIWAKLPDKYQVLDNYNKLIKPNGMFIITVESIDPYHLIADLPLTPVKP